VTNTICTHADRCDPGVDPGEDQVETPGAEAACLERRAKAYRQLGGGAGDGLGGADRLGKRAANFDQLRLAYRRDRLGEPPQRLVEPPARLRAEAQRQRRAGLGRQLADPLEPEQPRDDTGRQPQRRHRQRHSVAGRRYEDPVAPANVRAHAPRPSCRPRPPAPLAPLQGVLTAKPASVGDHVGGIYLDPLF
jgi:hypothetical protein